MNASLPCRAGRVTNLAMNEAELIYGREEEVRVVASSSGYSTTRAGAHWGVRACALPLLVEARMVGYG